jgi:uncharacterized protein YqjF (DUF2071 family)
MSSDSIAVPGKIVPVNARALRRVFLTGRWQVLAMLNWEVEPSLLEPLVPRGCELDFHHGKTFLSLVGFVFLDTRVWGIAVPGYRRFEEVNLRFYVRRLVDGEIHRGVCFVREIVPRWAIALVARLFYNEPYVALPMQHQFAGPVGEIDAEGDLRGAKEQRAPERCGDVAYRWQYRSRWNEIKLHYAGEPMPLAAGSHEEFIAEHYYGYCAQRDGGAIEYQVEHKPWKVWTVTECQVDIDAEANYGPTFAPVLSLPPTTAFLADGSPVAVLWPQRIGRAGSE